MVASDRIAWGTSWRPPGVAAVAGAHPLPPLCHHPPKLEMNHDLLSPAFESIKITFTVIEQYGIKDGISNSSIFSVVAGDDPCLEGNHQVRYCRSKSKSSTLMGRWSPASQREASITTSPLALGLQSATGELQDQWHEVCRGRQKFHFSFSEALSYVQLGTRIQI